MKRSHKQKFSGLGLVLSLGLGLVLGLGLGLGKIRPMKILSNLKLTQYK